jgi:hypothetical protein
MEPEGDQSIQPLLRSAAENHPRPRRRGALRRRLLSQCGRGGGGEHSGPQSGLPLVCGGDWQQPGREARDETTPRVPDGRRVQREGEA